MEANRYILEGRLTTNPILSALHRQGLKSNIYVHFQLVYKLLIGIPFGSGPFKSRIDKINPKFDIINFWNC